MISYLPNLREGTFFLNMRSSLRRAGFSDSSVITIPHQVVTHSSVVLPPVSGTQYQAAAEAKMLIPPNSQPTLP